MAHVIYSDDHGDTWRHWCRVWDVDYEWMRGRFTSKEMMNKPGFTIARWYDGVLENAAEIDQEHNLKAVVVWGCSGNSLARFNRVTEALNKIDLVVVIDPFPTTVASSVDRTDNMYLLPAASQYETTGSTTATNRSVQWRYKVVDPIYESKPDYEIVIEFAQRFGFYDSFTRNIKNIPDDITREINRGALAIGWVGITPERIRKHTDNWGSFDIETLKAQEDSPCRGEYYGLPWTCWTTDHPGTPILYDISKSVREGGLPFRNRFGLEHNSVSLLAGEASANPGSLVNGGYPEFSDSVFEKLGIELTAEERELIKDHNWKTNLSGTIVRKALENGMAPFR